jgi:hypothetical protein
MRARSVSVTLELVYKCFGLNETRPILAIRRGKIELLKPKFEMRPQSSACLR